MATDKAGVAKYLHIEPDPKQVSVLRYNKTAPIGSDPWTYAIVLLPDSTSDTQSKNSVLVSAYKQMGACCHCTAPATRMANNNLRSVDSVTMKAERIVILADHCDAPACTAKAAALVNAYTEQGIQAGKEAYYKCATCQLFFDTIERCSRCHLTLYCSAACQKKDWKRHRADCVKE